MPKKYQNKKPKTFVGKDCWYVGKDPIRYSEETIVCYEGIIMSETLESYICLMEDQNIHADKTSFLFTTKKNKVKLIK